MEFSFSPVETSNKARELSSASAHVLRIPPKRDLTPKGEVIEATRQDITPKSVAKEITRRDVTTKVKEAPKRETNLTKTKVSPRRTIELSSKVIHSFILKCIFQRKTIFMLKKLWTRNIIISCFFIK